MAWLSGVPIFSWKGQRSRLPDVKNHTKLRCQLQTRIMPLLGQFTVSAWAWDTQQLAGRPHIMSALGGNKLSWFHPNTEIYRTSRTNDPPLQTRQRRKSVDLMTLNNDLWPCKFLVCSTNLMTFRRVLLNYFSISFIYWIIMLFIIIYTTLCTAPLVYDRDMYTCYFEGVSEWVGFNGTST